MSCTSHSRAIFAESAHASPQKRAARAACLSRGYMFRAMFTPQRDRLSGGREHSLTTSVRTRLSLSQNAICETSRKLAIATMHLLCLCFIFSYVLNLRLIAQFQVSLCQHSGAVLVNKRFSKVN